MGRGVTAVLMGAVVLGVFVGGIWVYRLMVSPGVAMLISEGGAEWIRFDRRPSLEAMPRGVRTRQYRVRFSVPSEGVDGVVTFRAFKRAFVYLDGVPVLEEYTPFAEWRTARRVALGGRLTAGNHELSFVVFNENGPAPLLVYAPSLGLFSGGDWEASEDGIVWRRARSVNDPVPSELSRRFVSAGAAFMSRLPFLLLVFMVGAVWRFRWHRVAGSGGDLMSRWLDPSVTRWVLLAAWAGLALNNVGKIPFYQGFDLMAHVDYIRFIVEHKRLPLATEGVETFQAPLFYMVGAGPYLLLSQIFSFEGVVKGLRFIPLLCGLAQIEIAYRLFRKLYGEEPGIQNVGMVVVGFMPMNFYMSQYVGNEPLAALFSALLIATTLGLLREARRETIVKSAMVIGVLGGLAVLSKVSSLLVLPPVMALLVYVLSSGDWRGASQKERAVPLATVVGVASLVCGWYFVRNWMALGKGFNFGWDPSLGMSWWQDYGYRTPQYFLSFGESLRYPVFSSVMGFWDSLYSMVWADGQLSGEASFEHRPPWNYSLMLSGVLLGLVPSILFVVGASSSVLNFRASAKTGHLFAVSCFAMFFTGILYLVVTMPVYSNAKGTYTLGLLPCYALLVSRGYEVVRRWRFLDPLVHGALASWAVASYGAYFVV